ncbi:MAG: PD-(D/E)XK nuclease family protein [Firmicutes bacterium]|nr:PD-(D/E)XK nuclease family protein [[Eubacterium] siraeum]MCM1488225.1 PD-(D/E)XK nuclease family protein [Bacillota bacterium]
MNAELYLGGFGTGKTAAAYEKIKSLAEKGESCLLFVPEQFSFDAERAVYFAVGAKNLQYVKVTGFSKLSREILKEYKAAKPAADNAVKLITMWKAVEAARESLVCYGKTLNTPGFCRLMLKTVAAFRNAGVSPEDYRKILEREENLSGELAEKAEDFLKIYSLYDRSLTENLDDKLDDVSRAALLAREHGCFKGAHLFFDGFDSFSAVQKKFLSAAADSCESLTFCLAAEPEDMGAPCYLCIAKTVRDIREIAPFLTIREFKTRYRACGRDESPIEIYSAKTPYEEARLAAAKIHRLVMERSYRYRDILVLTADDSYQRILAEEFDKGEIPFFCDFPRIMTEKPAVAFVLQVLKALELDPTELLKLIESGFKRIPSENREDFNRLLSGSEIYRLSTAAACHRLTREDWERDWSNDPRKLLNPLESLRKAITEPLKKLREDLLTASDGAELSAVFMNYLLEQEGLKATFVARSKTGEGEGTDYIEVEENAAEENLRIWDALCEALSSMAYCLKGVKIDCNKYCLLLEEILSGVNLSNPPQVLDCVTAGDIERTRKASPKAVIILGANEGALPRKSALQSIFNFREIESLNGAGLELYDTNLNRWSKEQYFAKRAMELYGKRLIITYCRQSAVGSETNPSPLLENMGTAVPCEALPLDLFLNTEDDIKTALAENRDGDRQTAEELEKLISDSGYKAGLANASDYLEGRRSFSLSPDTARRLLTMDRYSPTALNGAFQCPFMYFCTYGLGLREQEEIAAASPADIGTAVHNIMRTALSEGIKGRSAEELSEIAEKAVERELNKALEKDPSYPERMRAVFRSLSHRIPPLLEQAKADMENGGFEPQLFEKKVGYIINDAALPNGRVEIYGIADRIDGMERDGKKYVRIIDYKTGRYAKEFSGEGVESGSDLQMLLYLFAEKAEAPHLIPAQVGYFNAGPAAAAYFDSFRPVTEEEEAKNWYEKHTFSGAVFDDPAAVAAAEKAEKAIKEKTRSPRKTYNKMLSLSAEKFGELQNYVDKEIILPKLYSLLRGEIDSLPLEKDGRTPCAYCGFQTICGNKGFRVRALDPDKELREFAGRGK